MQFSWQSGGGRQEMGIESSLYEAIQNYCELFVSLKPKITTGWNQAAFKGKLKYNLVMKINQLFNSMKE